MVLRLMLWILLLAGVWWFFKPRGRRPPDATSARAPAAPAPPGAPPGPARIARAEAMLVCARCGVHFPESEAARDAAGRSFCCREHRAAETRRDA